MSIQKLLQNKVRSVSEGQDGREEKELFSICKSLPHALNSLRDDCFVFRLRRSRRSGVDSERPWQLSSIVRVGFPLEYILP